MTKIDRGKGGGRGNEGCRGEGGGGESGDTYKETVLVPILGEELKSVP